MQLSPPSSPPVHHSALTPFSSAIIEIILVWRPSTGGSQMSHKVRGTSVKIFPNGIVMHRSCRGHEQVPDGVGERNDAVALEEHNSQAID